MKKKFRSKIALVMAFYILFASLDLPMYKIYADEISSSQKISIAKQEFLNNMQDKDVLLKGKSLGAVISLVPSAIPGLLKIMQVFMATLVFTDSWQDGLVGGIRNILSSIIEGNYTGEISDFFEKKLEQAQASTVAFLIAYDNFTTSTGKIADSVRTKLLKFYQEDFITTLESALAKGVDIATLTTYGVTKFFDLDIYNQIYNEVPGVTSFPTLYGKNGITNKGYSMLNGYRYLTTNANDSRSFTYNMMAGYDLAMQYVDKVQITRRNVEQYNYGWEGLSWTQQYYMKTAKDGLQYMIVFSIAKALSTNQRNDRKHDGISFGLFQVDSLGQVVTGNANNVYYRNSDERLNTFIPKTGSNLYSSVSGVNFGKLRDICVDLWGADVFPNVPDVWNLGTDSILDSNRLVDYSKNEPGVYDNEWGYQGNPSFPVPGLDTPIKFPTLKPGDSISVPNIPNNPSWDVVFPPSTFPGVDVYIPGDLVTNPDIPGDDVLNPDIPDVDVPDVDVPDVDVPGAPSLSWDWLKTLFNKLLELIQSILDWLTNFWDNLLDFLISLLVPDSNYWTDIFNDILTSLKSKIPDIDLGALENLGVGEKTFDDIYANFFGIRCLVVKGSVINSVISWARPILQGLIAIFLLLYNYNQIYKLIRGGSLVGASNTLSNITNGKIGGR